ncbi:MAG TPA: hypothetical protein VK178_13575 [Opitutaceae bacterium]|nr:hypothetical protein [Opitutaceae bacterium]
MKRSLAALLAASLLANVGLVAWSVRRDTATKPVVVPAVAPALSASPAVGPTEASAPDAKAPAPEPAKIWERPSGESARIFAQRLRAAGVPEHTARLLVGDALRGQYLERQRELIGSTAPGEFWKTAAAAADRDRQAELRALAREHRDLLVELFGPDENAAAELERERRLYGPLSPEKLERVDRIHADYGEMVEDVRTAAGGMLLPADRETLALLEQERRKDVAALLSAEELELYDLQTSATARALRARLAAFAPSEKEFRALFALQRDFDERHGAGGPLDESRQRERAVAANELDTRIHAALGGARYEEFRKTQDAGFRLAARLAERFGLPTRRAGDVYALARTTQTRLAVLRDDKAISAEAARASLVELARDTGGRLTTLLGVEGAELYRQASCGAWLRALERAAQEVEAATPSVAANSAPVTTAGVAPATAPEVKSAPTANAAGATTESTSSTGPVVPQRVPLPIAAQPNG